MQLLVDAGSVETYKILQEEVAQLRVLAENGEIWMQLAKYSDAEDMKETENILRHITSLCYRFVYTMGGWVAPLSFIENAGLGGRDGFRSVSVCATVTTSDWGVETCSPCCSRDSGM